MYSMFKSSQNLYVEIASFIIKQISLGVYRKDEPLPSCRKMALELKVNPNTVLRSYELLIEKKIIYSIPKKGYFIKSQEAEDDIKIKLDSLLNSIYSLGISKENLINYLQKGKLENDND